MATDDPWLSALRQQAAIVEKERMRLEGRRRDGWRVLQAEISVESVEAAYHRLLTDAPRASVVRHLRERVSSVRP